MAITQEQMNRVIYSKYLLERAKARQSEGNELASAEAIVLAHDSAEMLMRVAYDHLGIAQPYPFMDFWKLVEKKTKQPVPLKSQMDGLNKQRIEFKHGGRLPNPKTVAALLPNVEAFCEEISQLYLDKLDYRSASLATLIQNSGAKKQLEAAEIAQGKENIPQALTELRFAFGYLYEDIRKKYGDDLAKKAVWRGPHISTGYSEVDQQVKSLVSSLGIQQIISQLNDLSETVDMLAFGGDPASFRKFIRLTPHLIRTGFQPAEHLPVWPNPGTPTQEDYDFCRDFVINFALQAGL